MVSPDTYTIESAEILCGSPRDFRDIQDMRVVLEDTTSPITVRYTEQLFDSVINKNHIDFGGIEKSKGVIRDYTGYSSMMETLYIIDKMATYQKAPSVKEYVQTVLTAIQNIDTLSAVYSEGFRKNINYVMMEYNAFTLCCVEATTTILCEFVEYIKNPSNKKVEIRLKNNKYRANELYISQLQKFNKVNMNANYRKFIEEMNNKGQDNFTGAAIVGFGTIMAIALSIIPITRSLIYHFYNLRRKISDDLMVQATFIELHRTCVESNPDFTEEKKESILKKQDNLRLLLVRLADKIKVSNVKAAKQAEVLMKKDNSLMTLDKVKNGIDNSEFSLL